MNKAFDIKGNYVEEEGLLITINGIEEEIEYDFKCCDTFAIGEISENNDKEILRIAPKKVKLAYPSIEEVMADEEMCDYILTYRGLYDLKKEDIHFGDIAIAYGEVSIYQF